MLGNEKLLPNLHDWVHTVCVMTIVSVFAVPLLWSGVEAIILGRLPPMMGSDFGEWMFGPRELHGKAAVASGCSLVVFGTTFLALGVAHTRWAEDRPSVCLLPWIPVALDVLVYWWDGLHNAMNQPSNPVLNVFTIPS